MGAKPPRRSGREQVARTYTTEDGQVDLIAVGEHGALVGEGYTVSLNPIQMAAVQYALMTVADAVVDDLPAQSKMSVPGQATMIDVQNLGDNDRADFSIAVVCKDALEAMIAVTKGMYELSGHPDGSLSVMLRTRKMN